MVVVVVVVGSAAAAGAVQGDRRYRMVEGRINPVWLPASFSVKCTYIEEEEVAAFPSSQGRFVFFFGAPFFTQHHLGHVFGHRIAADLLASN